MGRTCNKTRWPKHSRHNKRKEKATKTQGQVKREDAMNDIAEPTKDPTLCMRGLISECGAENEKCERSCSRFEESRFTDHCRHHRWDDVCTWFRTNDSIYDA